MTMVSVPLTAAEFILASTLSGLRLHRGLYTQTGKNVYGAELQNEPALHFFGVLGEFGGAKWANIYPNLETQPSYKGDYPNRFEVRTTTWDTGRLLLHKPDPDDRRFVLAVYLGGPTITLVGWIKCVDGKKEEWWEEPKKGNGRFCYCVPQSALLPMDELKELL